MTAAAFKFVKYLKPNLKSEFQFQHLYNPGAPGRPGDPDKKRIHRIYPPLSVTSAPRILSVASAPRIFFTRISGFYPP